MRYQFSESKLLLAVGVIALFFAAYRYKIRDQFDDQLWKSKISQRRSMIDSLERYHLRIGMERSEVKKLLGDNDYYFAKADEDFYRIYNQFFDNGDAHYCLVYNGRERLKSFGLRFTGYD
jgi:hypothetical protein